jgi:hypothetical protein
MRVIGSAKYNAAGKGGRFARWQQENAETNTKTNPTKHQKWVQRPTPVPGRNRFQTGKIKFSNVPINIRDMSSDENDRFILAKVQSDF